jgi:hypothetical protein
MASTTVNFTALPCSVISDGVLMFLHAASRLSLLQARRHIAPELQRGRLLHDILAKIHEINDTLSPLVKICARYPLFTTAERLDYQLCGLADSRTVRHLLGVWGLDNVTDESELQVLDWLHPTLARFQCPLCAWIAMNEDIPEVQRVAVMLFSMDWTLHFYYAEAPLTIITFSDPATGVCGSCAVRGRIDSESEDGSTDCESDGDSD